MAKRPGTSLFKGLHTAEIQEELRRRQRGLPKLYAQLKKAEAKVVNLTDTIRMLEGAAASRQPGRRRAAGLTKRGTPRIRPENKRSLIEVLTAVLRGKTLTVSEAMAKAKTAGYKTTSPNFRVIVNQALLKSDKFKKVSHGKYTAR